MRTLLENLREDIALAGDNLRRYMVGGRYVINDIGQAIAEIERLEKIANQWRSFADDPPKPGVGMIIYQKARNADGRLPVGVAYLNVSGKWSDSASFDPQEVRYWMAMPEPNK